MVKYRVYWMEQRAGLVNKLFDSLRDVNDFCKHFTVLHIEAEVV